MYLSAKVEDKHWPCHYYSKNPGSFVIAFKRPAFGYTIIIIMNMRRLADILHPVETWRGQYYIRDYP
jgi:hypothetical protein